MYKNIISAIVLTLIFGGIIAYGAEREVPVKEFVITTEEIDVHSHTHPEAGNDGPHSTWFHSRVIPIEEDMIVTGIRAQINNAPQDILHHAMLYETHEVNAICGNVFDRANELYAVSMNTIREPVRFEKPYALFLKKGSALYVEAMEHTATPPLGPGGDYENVSLSIILETRPGSKQRTRPLEFYRLRLDDTPCQTPIAHEAFKVPPGAKDFVRTSDDIIDPLDGSRYTFKTDGTIISVGSNLWPMKGATNGKAFLNGNVIAEFVPRKLNRDWEWSIPGVQNISVAVKAGDEITSEAVYTNPYADKPIVDASGMIGFYFAPNQK